MKFHSHTEGYASFSSTDDESDRQTFSSISAWLDDGESHGSVVMLPDGSLFGRSIRSRLWQPFDSITVVGDDILHWHSGQSDDPVAPALVAQTQLFGAGTTARLRHLRVGVVGCSGTGSIVVELLTRLGVGTLILVDDDRVEERNLNRIVNARRADIDRPKVDVLAEGVQLIGFGTKVIPLPLNLYDVRAVNAIAACDLVFGCMDTAEGRHLLNRIATFYILPYFDLGVHLRANDRGGIDEACGVVHYIQPGGSSLLSRGAYGLERVRAENLRRTDPEKYREQLEVNYIEGVDEKSPAVVSVNATIASLAVNEFLARIHPFRSCKNSDGAIIYFDFMETMVVREEEREACPLLKPLVGLGDVIPILDMPSLSS